MCLNSRSSGRLQNSCAPLPWSARCIRHEDLRRHPRPRPHPCRMYDRPHRAVRRLRTARSNRGTQSGLSCACWRCHPRRVDRRRKPRATPSAPPALPALLSFNFKVEKISPGPFQSAQRRPHPHPPGVDVARVVTLIGAFRFCRENLRASPIPMDTARLSGCIPGRVCAWAVAHEGCARKHPSSTRMGAGARPGPGERQFSKADLQHVADRLLPDSCARVAHTCVTHRLFARSSTRVTKRIGLDGIPARLPC